ncbi:MAG: hypothetical protein J0H39_01700 [Alphaproteobacteria bacterium]|nr:hypothetical protein [Alphaproteobacteria bacterium]
MNSLPVRALAAAASPAALLAACLTAAIPGPFAFAGAAVVVLGARAAIVRPAGGRAETLVTAILALMCAAFLRQAIGVPLRPTAAYVSAVQIAFIVGVPALFGLGFGLAAICRGGARDAIVATLISAGAGLLASELAFVVGRDDAPKRWAVYQAGRAAADARGERFDGRADMDVVTELRQAGVDAWPMFSISNFLYAEGPAAADRANGPLTLSDGRKILPFASIPDVTTVYCNEGGRFLIFRSDEMGFNNPAGTWSRSDADIVVVGDSFAQGACVPQGQGMTDRLRATHPSLVNLGMGGTGPLYQLATLSEFGARFAPRKVVWLFFEGNDLHTNLAREIEFEALRRRTEPGAPDDGQIGAAPEIAAFLRATADRLIDAALAQPETRPESRFPPFGEIVRLRQIMARAGFSVCPTRAQMFFPDFERVMRAARTKVESWGGELLVVYLPAWDRSCDALNVVDGAWHWPHAEVMAALTRAGIAALDLHGAFTAHPDPARLFYYPGSHYSPEGHAFVAAAIAARLAAPGAQSR